MRVRLILIQTRSGIKARQEAVHDGDVLTIGRHSGSDVYLPELSIALNHSKIEIVGNRVRLDLVEGAHFIVNDRLKTTSQTLQPGTTVRIGHHQLRVVRSVAGDDLSLEIEQIESRGHAAEELEKRTKLGILGGFWNPRRLSWAAGVTVLALLLVVPLIQSRSPVDLRTGSFLTRSWNPGPIAPAHQYFADDCATCHVDAFQAVPDQTCLGCHEGIAAHSSDGNEVLDEWRCASCHLEHNEDRQLAALPDATCQNCHSDLSSVFAATGLLDVGDFGADHPQFRPSMVIDEDSGLRERVPPGIEVAPIRSGMPFAHQSHLEGPIKDVLDRDVVLECADCHRTGPAETDILPISFQTDCQRCHSLAFDAGHEDQEAPHVDVTALSTSVFQFYSALALEGHPLDAEAPSAAGRRPGREISEEERLGLLALVRERSDAALDSLLGSEGVCLECHTLRTIGETTEVEPVNLTPAPEGIDWMPAAAMSHASHASTVACEHCHSGVREADASSPLLLPQVELCRDCHTGDTPRPQRVTSPCILCHAFHQPRYGLLRSQ
jgi:hypothetical protein